MTEGVCACSWTVIEREREREREGEVWSHSPLPCSKLAGGNQSAAGPTRARATPWGWQSRKWEAACNPGNCRACTAHSHNAKWERSKHTTWKFFHLYGIKLNVIPGVFLWHQGYTNLSLLESLCLHFSPPLFSAIPNTGRDLFITLVYIAMH